VADFDAAKLGGLRLAGDARVTIEALDARLAGWTVDAAYRERAERLRADWDREVSRLYHLGWAPLPAQSEVVGAVNELSRPRDVVVCAAGSMPGDLHKLWRTRDPKQYHVEYGYSCMGYEIAGGLGVKMADPDREVYVMVGDGSYLMMAQEIATSVQERRKLVVVLVDNAGYKSIGALSRSKGSAGFGTRSLMGEGGGDDLHDAAPPVPVDLALNAEGLGAHVIRARSTDELRDALVAARDFERTVVVHVPVDRYESVPDYESWWDVPVAEVSETEAVRRARTAYESERRNERWLL
jgi:3D-(3,5/4)-trihydroxycyclohexane-1,2-dione acylhydrolase (decyclizing)